MRSIYTRIYTAAHYVAQKNNCYYPINNKNVNYMTCKEVKENIYEMILFLENPDNSWILSVPEISKGLPQYAYYPYIDSIPEIRQCLPRYSLRPSYWP